MCALRGEGLLYIDRKIEIYMTFFVRFTIELFLKGIRDRNSSIDNTNNEKSM